MILCDVHLQIFSLKYKFFFVVVVIVVITEQRAHGLFAFEHACVYGCMFDCKRESKSKSIRFGIPQLVPVPLGMFWKIYVHFV